MIEMMSNEMKVVLIYILKVDILDDMHVDVCKGSVSEKQFMNSRRGSKLQHSDELWDSLTTKLPRLWKISQNSILFSLHNLLYVITEPFSPWFTLTFLRTFKWMTCATRSCIHPLCWTSRCWEHSAIIRATVSSDLLQCLHLFVRFFAYIFFVYVSPNCVSSKSLFAEVADVSFFNYVYLNRSQLQFLSVRSFVALNVFPCSVFSCHFRLCLFNIITTKSSGKSVNLLLTAKNIQVNQNRRCIFQETCPGKEVLSLKWILKTQGHPLIAQPFLSAWEVFVLLLLLISILLISILLISILLILLLL